MDNPCTAARAGQAEGSRAEVTDSDLAERGERARRAASFGAAAGAYAEHRPDYALAAIGWALAPALGTGRRPITIVDLGAGTGKLTAQLAGLDLDGGRPDVVAVEPDPQMLAELRRQLAGVRAVTGSAEAIPLPDASVDAVLAGQAAHWFDLDRAMPEIARVLAPGGVFAGLWNADDDRVEWVDGLHKACGRRGATLTAFTRGDDDEIASWLRTPGRALFGPPEFTLFDHAQARTADSLVETLRTHSMFLIMQPAEREAVLAQVRDFLAATPQTATGEFSLPLCTLTMRTVRR